MIGGIGWGELIIVLVILLLIFGPSRLGDLGSALGKGIKGFKKSMKEPDEVDITPSKDDAKSVEGSTLESSSANKSSQKEAK
ncbi:MAG: twin-arginine translocase TatA/TatE family subunit [Deltaproteobacteria bacterium]